MKVIPNRILCNQPTEVNVYGQLFKKGKGVSCGLTNLGNLANLKARMNDMHPPYQVCLFSMSNSNPPAKLPPLQVVPVISEYNMFRLPLCSQEEGFVLVNSSNDQKTYGLGKMIHFQKGLQN